MLGHSPFYRSTIKNVTACFGSLFNDLKIVREKNGKSQTVKIPLSYASADKAFSRKKSDPTLNYNMMNTFPRMSFYLTSFAYDPTRKTSPARFAALNNNYVFSPVPYVLSYDLYIATTTIEDGLQIIEQILPFFNPEFTIKAEMMPEIGLEYDIPYVLNSVSYVDPSLDSDYTDTRIIEWTLSFSAQTFIIGPTRTRDVIKHVRLNLFNENPFDDDTYLETIKSDVVPDTATKDDDYEITTEIVNIGIGNSFVLDASYGEINLGYTNAEFVLGDANILYAEPGTIEIIGKDIYV